MARMEQCRACRAPDPYLFLQLGDHAPAQMLIRAEDAVKPQPTFELDAHVCLRCGLIQVADQIPPDFFRHYLYVPSGAATMHGHFERFAKSLSEAVPAGSLVVDVGCNDGLFLAECARRGLRTLGVDPAANIAELSRAKGLEVVTDYFEPHTASQLRERFGAADVVITTNTFNHIGDLHTFMRAVDLLLSDDGTFVIELPRAKEMIENNAFDNIYHEHVSSFSLLSIKTLVSHFGMDVVDAEPLPEIHGGSMRVFVRRRATGAEVSLAVVEMLREEEVAGTLEKVTYDALARRVLALGKALRAVLDDLKRQGLKIAGYGASARGNTLMTFFGIDRRYLDFLVDKNPLKRGMLSPNTRNPIRDISAIEEEAPDALLMLAWNFFDEIRAQQAAFVSKGGRFLVPLPFPRLVS